MKNASDNQIAEEIVADYVRSFWRPRKYHSYHNYYFCPFQYNPDDTWITKGWWIKNAKQCIDNQEGFQLTALEILLSEGYVEYLDLAIDLANNWWTNSGADPYYWYDLLIHLPDDNRAKKEAVLLADESELRSELCLVETLCRNKIKKGISFVVAELDRHIMTIDDIDDFDSSTTLSVLKAFGRANRHVLPDKTRIRLLQILAESLAKDEKHLNQYGCEYTGNERSLWIRDEISEYAWILGDDQIFISLEESVWFEKAATNRHLGITNDSLLAWSTRSKTLQSLPLLISKQMQKASQSDRMDGAIAWWRMNRFATDDINSSERTYFSAASSSPSDQSSPANTASPHSPPAPRPHAPPPHDAPAHE